MPAARRRETFFADGVRDLAASTSMFSNSTCSECPATATCNWTSAVDAVQPTPDVDSHRCWIVTCLLAPFAVFTIAGNGLVMAAVAREPCLRASVTNYFIVSLAVADLVIGAVVMPFSIVLEASDGWWPFGADWCDLWHSFDVLASTASILNLSVIALDRYWAITDPIAYPHRMSTSRSTVLIAVVWICSAAISFPAIAWWRRAAAANKTASVEATCLFTDDSAYLIFSSLVSFYAPVSVILYAYYRIYAAAAAQIRSLERGTKVLNTRVMSSGSRAVLGSETVTLRIHRGGTASRCGAGDSTAVWYRRAADTGQGRNSDRTGVRMAPNNRQVQSVDDARNSGRTASGSDDDDDDDISSTSTGGAEFVRRWRTTLVTRRPNRGVRRRRLGRVARERKAAKTLGIVMGVFCACWVPFFVTNLLYGACRHVGCVQHADILFRVFTWLGYINSGMNPVIYACSLRDFRRAFGRLVGYRHLRCWRYCCWSESASLGRPSPGGIELASSPGYELPRSDIAQLADVS